MSLTWTDAIGWAATAVFVASYFFRRAAVLRAVQLLGGALWLLFGVLIASKPVIVCNALVMLAAGWTLVRGAKETRAAPDPALPHQG